MNVNLDAEAARWAALSIPLTQWYSENRRPLPWRDSPTAYETWISEIMLQQTRVEAVKAYYTRFLAELPNVSALANADEERLMKLWEGLGYYSRARNLQKAARQILDRHNGALPADYNALLKLAGIGPYTAGAIASIAFGLPVPAVDGNVLRVFARLQNDRSDIALPETKERVNCLLSQVLRGLSVPGDFNQAIMELGAVVCVPNGPPRCESCPVSAFCAGRKARTMLELPVKSAKKPRRVEPMTVLLLTRDGRFALRQRKKSGLLAGLWELPNLSGHLQGAALTEAVRTLGLEPLRIEPLCPAKHIFTHVEWHMQGYRVTVEEESGASLHWVDKAGLTKCALPSAFHYYLPIDMKEILP